MKKGLVIGSIFLALCTKAQTKNYPQNYFRNPLDIPMQLVSNFGELRANHWHMGLDIRTQQRENLIVHAAADGYVAKIKIEPSGFGRAIYINHRNGYTTLYAHLNDFFPALEAWVKEQQYLQKCWQVELMVPPNLFPVQQGQFIAYSGTTGGSEGPHVHFEIRDTKTEACLNPLLFNMPITDHVPPTLLRLALYNREESVYAQSPKMLPIKKAGAAYVVASSNPVQVGNRKISFAIGAIDRYSGSGNGNGIYSARILLDGEMISQFVLDKIDYNQTRYVNAQIDYRYKYNGGAYVQQISPATGDASGVYTPASGGIIDLKDAAAHSVRIEVEDAAGNQSVIQFTIQYNERLARPAVAATSTQLLPGNVNVFEAPNFEAYTSEHAVYDTVVVNYSEGTVVTGAAISPLHTFLTPAIPVHDSITVRIKTTKPVAAEDRDKVVIYSTSGSRKAVEKAHWTGSWLWAKFRQWGSFQALVDNTPPTLNAPGYGDTIDLRRSSRIVFTPKDNLGEINFFDAELDGQWLRFTNDKGYSYIYKFDEKFPPGVHQLTVTVEDVAGNRTTKTWYCRR